MLTGKKILVTGPTGQVALPITLALAQQNEVWGIARFKDGAAEERLETAGVTCVADDLSATDFAALPSDFDYVLNFAVARGGHADWDRDLAINGEATGLLMQHCRNAVAFLHCSSTAVYRPAGTHPVRETDALGDNHGAVLPTYSIAKIAAEAVVRTCARAYGLPATIARLNVPYGDTCGWPLSHLESIVRGKPIAVHPDGPSLYNPIHMDDLIRQVPLLLEAATVPATIVNWAGEQASLEGWCSYLGELVGIAPEFVPSERALSSVTTDNTRMYALIGRPEVEWRDGLRRLVAARHPELLRRE